MISHYDFNSYKWELIKDFDLKIFEIQIEKIDIWDIFIYWNHFLIEYNLIFKINRKVIVDCQILNKVPLLTWILKSRILLEILIIYKKENILKSIRS